MHWLVIFFRLVNSTIWNGSCKKGMIKFQTDINGQSQCKHFLNWCSVFACMRPLFTFVKILLHGVEFLMLKTRDAMFLILSFCRWDIVSLTFTPCLYVLLILIIVSAIWNLLSFPDGFLMQLKKWRKQTTITKISEFFYSNVYLHIIICCVTFNQTYSLKYILCYFNLPSSYCVKFINHYCCHIQFGQACSPCRISNQCLWRSIYQVNSTVLDLLVCDRTRS